MERDCCKSYVVPIWVRLWNIIEQKKRREDSLKSGQGWTLPALRTWAAENRTMWKWILAKSSVLSH